jgi:hypothetical protein
LARSYTDRSHFIGYQQAPAPHGHSGGFTAPQQPHQDAQTIYGQGQNSGAWHHGEFDEATEYASRETGNDKSMFSSLLSSVLSGQQQHEQAQPHEIEHARAAQRKLYGEGSRGNQPVHDDDIASAAAMQAVERSGSSDSGGLQSVIGMAMSEVTKLMGKQSGGSTGAQQGGSSGGQSAMIQKAISMAIKLYASKQAGSAAGSAAGGSSSNPLGSMMGMFMGGGSKPASSQGDGYSQPPSHQPNASGYAPPPSHQGAGSNNSNPPPQNQGHSGYSQPPPYDGHQQSGYQQQHQQAPYGQQQEYSHSQQQQQAPYGQQQGYSHSQQQQQAPYGQQQDYSHQQQQAPYGQQQDYSHQQQQAPYGQQQQQQGGSGGSGFEAVAANLLNKFLK